MPRRRPTTAIFQIIVDKSYDETYSVFASHPDGSCHKELLYPTAQIAQRAAWEYLSKHAPEDL